MSGNQLVWKAVMALRESVRLVGKVARAIADKSLGKVV